MGIPVSKSKAQYPFYFGNANIDYSNGIVCAFFDTEWTKSSDSLNHQGSECAAVQTDTMELLLFDTWEGSHSFGVSMIPTDYGFAAIQKGDADDGRGINFNAYYADESSFQTDYSTNDVSICYSGQIRT